MRDRLQRAAIFDWGGVLMRTEDHAPRLAWDRRLGLPPGSVESVVHGIDAWRQAQCGLITTGRYWEAVGAALGLPPAIVAELRRDFYAGDHLDESLVALIRGLRRLSVRIGLLSNNTLDLLDDISALGIQSLLDCCVISAQIGIMKPDPLAYQAILRQLDVAAKQAVFIDDAADNVAGARACGMVSIQFRPGLDVPAAVRGWLADRADKG
jgi:putative hydrolase of the HAD superfamily